MEAMLITFEGRSGLAAFDSAGYSACVRKKGDFSFRAICFKAKKFFSKSN